MVPLLGVHDAEEDAGAEQITRYNMYNSSADPRRAGEGYTSGDAIEAFKRSRARRCRAATTSPGRASRSTRRSAGTRPLVFLIVLVFVYLVLAAQYESFLLPLRSCSRCPPGVFGSFLLLQLLGLANDIYAQVGL